MLDEIELYTRDILALLQQAKHKRVLIIGDAMLDHYVHGRVTRMSPEAPVPVVEQEREEHRLGGAANVLLNVLALGMQATLVTVIGKDSAGDLFLERLRQIKAPTTAVVQALTRPTTVKTRVLSNGQQMLRIDREITDPITTRETAEVLKLVTTSIEANRPDVIIFEDYDKGVITPALIASVTQLADSRSIPWVVDPKKRHFFTYRGAHVFKPNLKELRDVVPFEVQPEAQSLQRACDWLRGQLDHACTFVTLSEHGVFIESREGGTGTVYATEPVAIADVSGAGDTVMAIVALGVACGAKSAVLARLANLAGAQVCAKSGVVPVDVDALYRSKR